jgi:hypothetical protein
MGTIILMPIILIGGVYRCTRIKIKIKIKEE